MRRWSKRNAFTGSSTASSSLAQVGGSELGREGLCPQPGGQIGVALSDPSHQVSCAKPPWIDIEQPVTAVEPEAHPGMCRLLHRVKQQRSGHPQVDEQMRTTRQGQIEVLPGPAHPLDHGPASAMPRPPWDRRDGSTGRPGSPPRRAAAPPDGAPAGGGWSRPRAARACHLSVVAHPRPRRAVASTLQRRQRPPHGREHRPIEFPEEARGEYSSSTSR